VLSDSGTISEESSILGFPAVTLRDAIERPEALDAGAIITAGVAAPAIRAGVRLMLEQSSHAEFRIDPPEYQVADFSVRAVNFIYSTASTHHSRISQRLSHQ